MRRRKIKGIGVSSRGMYIRSTSDILPKLEGYAKYCRYTEVICNWSLYNNTNSGKVIR
ncbi:hypothetical protein KAW18_14290 [candidate division WOR-3 bacterium]|nr:hypothetical protein [candidate division WOR-3 bacterium]